MIFHFWLCFIIFSHISFGKIVYMEVRLSHVQKVLYIGCMAASMYCK